MNNKGPFHELAGILRFTTSFLLKNRVDTFPVLMRIIAFMRENDRKLFLRSASLRSASGRSAFSGMPLRYLFLPSLKLRTLQD